MTNISRKIKKTKNNYWKPTPKKWRVFGDSLLAASTTAAGFAVLASFPVVGLAAMGVGVVGKFISNFFTEDTEDSKSK